MKFVLISRHPSGSSIPAGEAAQNLDEMGKWIALLRATVAIPIRGGKTVSAESIEDYVGDVGGLVVFEADELDQAVTLAKKSPGLKYGFIHDVFPEIALDDAVRIE